MWVFEQISLRRLAQSAHEEEKAFVSCDMLYENSASAPWSHTNMNIIHMINR